MPTLVRNIMTPYNKLVILSPHDTVDKARKIMQERNIHSVIVERARGGHYWQIFTETDLLMALGSGVGANKILIGKWSNVATHIADPDWTCEKAREQMIRNGVKHLPVMDDSYQLLGIISSRDIIDNC